jgi:hypothetical protein
MRFREILDVLPSQKLDGDAHAGLNRILSLPQAIDSER